MIGLCIGARPRAGVVFQPVGDRLFWASEGHGAWLLGEGGSLRGRRVIVNLSGRGDKDLGVVSTGDGNLMSTTLLESKTGDRS